ncbi:hypothetical protein [Methylophilus sp. QUAN]|uniref:hypothetical protein n=1 Tax=Methylophilus sp. QUAN TaxID=2781020 RepID=UPI00351C2F8D
MSLNREDMLRELELLPVWRARVPAPTSLQAATVVEAVATPLVAEVAVEVVAEPVVEAVTPEVVELEVPVSIEFEQAPQAPLPEVNEPPEVAVELLVQTPWLLYCSQTEDAQSQQLLQNILRALQLPLEVVTLYQQQLVSAQVDSRFCVLFGLDAANRFLAADHLEIAAVRGKILTDGDRQVVVTHHPQAMLENSLLKREVWQDLCLLLAKYAEVAA